MCGLIIQAAIIVGLLVLIAIHPILLFYGVLLLIALVMVVVTVGVIHEGIREGDLSVPSATSVAMFLAGLAAVVLMLAG